MDEIFFCVLLPDQMGHLFKATIRYCWYLSVSLLCPIHEDRDSLRSLQHTTYLRTCLLYGTMARTIYSIHLCVLNE